MVKYEVLKEISGTERIVWQASPGPAHSRLGGNLHSACHCVRQSS